MNNSKSNFKELVAKIEALKETEQGLLKGGFTTAKAVSLQEDLADNNCGNTCERGCKVKESL